MRASETKLIYLIGMMGSGKTTLGRQLATRLGYSFVDLDVFIAQREGSSVPQLFAQQGQDGFRVLERAALEAVVAQHRQAVIATGGGAACFLNNIGFMNQSGSSLFLDVPEAELLKRLQRSDLQERPLLAGKSKEELAQFITKTLAERRRFYEQATLKVSQPPFTVDALLALLNHT